MRAGGGGDPEVATFFTNLAVCNTVVPLVLENGHFVYQVRVYMREGGWGAGFTVVD